MGELIGLLIKGMVALAVFSAYALWHLIRLSVLAVAYVVRVTVQLLRQPNSGQYSPDRRYWWNGQKWVPALPTAMWIVPGGFLAALLLVVVLWTTSLNTPPGSNNPGGSVADVQSSPSDLSAASPAVTPSTAPRISPSPLPPSPKATPRTVRATPRTVPPAAPPNTCGAPANPFGYDFCPPASVIYSPPSSFCGYFNCIPSFWDSTKGYVEECHDGTYSHSGGRPGACSYHGGELRPLYS